MVELHKWRGGRGGATKLSLRRPLTSLLYHVQLKVPELCTSNGIILEARPASSSKSSDWLKQIIDSEMNAIDAVETIARDTRKVDPGILI